MRLLLAAFLGLVAIGSSAQGQLMLQGAVASRDKTKAPIHPDGAAAQHPPSEATLIGRDLSRDGSSGHMLFTRAGGNFELARLALDGESMIKPGDSCQIEIVAQAKIALRPAGRPAGLARYEADLPACPFAFDVLDSAVLVSAARPTCDFVAADCRVALGGLWGPAGNSFDARRAQAMTRALVATEAGMRADYRALLKQAGKDRDAIKAIAGEQAGFSSQREMLCRDYAQEVRHGFCALRITEARLFALQSRLGKSDKGKAGARPALLGHSGTMVKAAAPKPQAGPSTP